ncbi:MAG: CopG family transcriptional regulator [Thermoleophilaceae bacterium]
MRRTQIYLDEQQTQELDERASTRGATRSELIREAVDSYLGADEDETARLARFHEAVKATAGVAPYLPAGDEYVEEIRSGCSLS